MCRVHAVKGVNKGECVCLRGRCVKEAARILADLGCHGQGATSQGHDLSAVGLLRGQEGDKRPKANLSCRATAVSLSE